MRFEWDGPAVHELADLVVYQSVMASGLDDGKTLSGVSFMMLDPHYAACKPNHEGHIVLTMGGSDPHGLTEKVWRQLALLREVVVVTGPARKPLNILDTLDVEGVRVLHAPESLVNVLNGAALCVCSLGMTTYEALAAGVPCLVTNWTAEHEKTALALQAADVLWNAGMWQDFDPKVIKFYAGEMLWRPGWKRMSKKARALVDGKGVARVADRICQ